MKRPEAAKEGEASVSAVSRPSGSRGGGLLMKRRSTVIEKPKEKAVEKPMPVITEEDSKAARLAEINRVNQEKEEARAEEERDKPKEKEKKKGWSLGSGLKKTFGAISGAVTKTNDLMQNPMQISKAIGEKIGDKIGDVVADKIPEKLVVEVPKFEKLADATTYTDRLTRVKDKIADGSHDLADKIKGEGDYAEDNILN